MGKGISKPRRLTPKQAAAARFRVEGDSMEVASRKAGFSEDYSKSCRVFIVPAVVAEVDRLMNESIDASKLEKTHILKRLMLMGFANLDDYLTYTNNTVTLVPSDRLTRDQLYCIEEVTKRDTSYGTTIKFKLCDRQRALESLGKYLKMFVERLEVTEVEQPVSDLNTEEAVNLELERLVDLVESGDAG